MTITHGTNRLVEPEELGAAVDAASARRAGPPPATAAAALGRPRRRADRGHPRGVARRSHRGKCAVTARPGPPVTPRRRPVAMLVHSYYEEDPRVRRQAETLVATGRPVDVFSLRRPDDPPAGTLAGVRITRLDVQRHQGSPIATYLAEYSAFLVRAAFAAGARPPAPPLRSGPGPHAAGLPGLRGRPAPPGGRPPAAGPPRAGRLLARHVGRSLPALAQHAATSRRRTRLRQPRRLPASRDSPVEPAAAARILGARASLGGSCDAVLTVNEPTPPVDRPLGSRGARRHELPRRLRRRPTPGRTGSASALGLRPGRAIVLYQGILAERGIEQAMDAILEVPDAVLVLLGFGDALSGSADAAARSPYRGRVLLLAASRPSELLAWPPRRDIMLMPIQPTTRQPSVQTPQKLFEAIARACRSWPPTSPPPAPSSRPTCSRWYDPGRPGRPGPGDPRVVDDPAWRGGGRGPRRGARARAGLGRRGAAATSPSSRRSPGTGYPPDRDARITPGRRRGTGSVHRGHRPRLCRASACARVHRGGARGHGRRRQRARVAELNAGHSPIEDITDDRLGAALAAGFRAVAPDRGHPATPTPSSSASRRRSRPPATPTSGRSSRPPSSSARASAPVTSSSSSRPPSRAPPPAPSGRSSSGDGPASPARTSTSPSPPSASTRATRRARASWSRAWSAASTPAATARAAALLRSINDTVVQLSSPDAAEMAKLLENVFRNVNIAFVNQLALLCERMGLDVWEVIDAAATKPFGFMKFTPGPGRRRPLHPGRPVLPGLAGPRVRLRRPLRRARRRHQLRDAAPRRRPRRRGASTTAAER